MREDAFDIIYKNLNMPKTKLFEERLVDFEKLFKTFNSHTNLVSKNDEKNLFEKHIYDSLCLKYFLSKYEMEENIKLMDIGTGGGFPAIPVSIAFPEIEVYPIDSIAKKIGFVELVQKELRLDKMQPMCKRIEDLDISMKESFDVVTSRAVAPLNVLLEYAVPFLKKGGYFVAFKSIGSEEEIKQAQNALKVLNSEVVEEIEYHLPDMEEFTRELIVIRKKDAVNKIYPRKSGLPKKCPL